MINSKFKISTQHQLTRFINRTLSELVKDVDIKLKISKDKGIIRYSLMFPDYPYLNDSYWLEVNADVYFSSSFTFSQLHPANVKILTKEDVLKMLIPISVDINIINNIKNSVGDSICTN